MRHGQKEGRRLKLTYRSRRRLQRLGVTLGYILSIGSLVLVCWMIWLDRHVVYSPDGAKLDYNWQISEEGLIAVPPTEGDWPIRFNEGADLINTSTELTPISGYYATTAMLLESVSDVEAAIKTLPAGSAVMLDLKSGFGNFYYNTEVPDASIADQADTAAITQLIKDLNKSNYYLIARIPAFRDRAYGLEHTNYGLPTSKGYLWSDSGNCYWLNPASAGAVNYLIAIAMELRELGFDEVVFTDFKFPNTDQIVFNSSLTKDQALYQAAEALVISCSTERFCVSFASSNRDFVLPAGRTRLYLEDVSANRAAEVYEASAILSKDIQLVFLTETNDTRFDNFNVMRPMPAARGTN